MTNNEGFLNSEKWKKINTIVVGNGNGGPADFSDFGSTLRIEEFDFEVLVLLELHVVDDRNPDYLIGLEKITTI